ncbi:uncharacterized protein BJX67DRAFT_382980 [Aspergillus lucknowensis]|uniref:Nucleoside phosphorylase domain-containing protein n=1 Tax=Aspergillus lucknowensis TaxID=176173 RepID=A0ABR4LL07_9EURO
MSVDGEQHFLNLVIHNKSDLSDKPQTLFIQEVAPMFGAFMRSMSDHTQLDYGELQKIKIPPGETKTIYASGVNALPIGRPPFKVPGAMGTEGSIVLGAEGEGPVVKIYWRDPIDNIFDSESSGMFLNKLLSWRWMGTKSQGMQRNLTTKISVKSVPLSTLPIPGIKLRRDEYTIGWICALPVELAAAQALLDDTHADLPVPTSDHNTYTLGRIGSHNTVIACLPSGIYGTTSATSVVNQMLNSFRNIRYGLIVGIGGGAPSETSDVRLGDIVVSRPTGRFPGVVQYDYGKTIREGYLEPTGTLNKPPQILLTATAKVEANHRKGENRISTHLAEIRTKVPTTFPNILYPDQLSDNLFQAEYDHPDPGTCCGNCDKSKIVSRNPRTTDDPKVHYGLIASGNQVMKHGRTRDRLAREHGILCFEMEAAGLMDSLPCLVIRGISDYADSHKNDQWREYAAATSAAYAKELLSVIHGNRDLERAPSSDTNRLVSRWLTMTNFSAQQLNILREREQGTGQWLLEAAEYQKWVRNEGQTLFCPGIPGAGKTMMSSIVVDSLRKEFPDESETGIACLFCSYKKQNEQTSAHLVANIMKQLIQDRFELPSKVKSLYNIHTRRDTRPSVRDLVMALESVIKSYSRVFLVIDALDECAGPVRAELLQEIFHLQKQTRFNLFATSRHNPNIKHLFQESGLLEIRASSRDLERYLDGRMSRLSACVVRNPDLRQRVRTEIINAAGEMFLLAELHLKSLEGMTRPKLIIKALEKLPQGSGAYNQVYEETMSRIEMQNQGLQELARHALAWITCARRPLRTLELQHALAVEIGVPHFDLDNIPELDEIVSVCEGLVTTDKENDTVNLVHYTAQEYLETTLYRWFPNAQNHIAKACVTYLSLDAFNMPPTTDAALRYRLQRHPLYDYAARNWGHHAREGSAGGDHLILEFLRSESKVLATGRVLLAEHDNGYLSSCDTPKGTTGMHLAAYFGLKEAVLALIASGHDHNVQNSWGRTPFWWAAVNGHDAVVKVLLTKNDTNVNAVGRYDLPHPQLWWDENNEGISDSSLATKNVIRGIKSIDKQTPLWWAAEHGHHKVVALLLSNDAVDPTFKNRDGHTPFFRAASNGHEAVVREFLTRADADISSEYIRGFTALSSAAKQGHTAIVKQLLQAGGFDVNHRDYAGQTPLFLASENGHEEVVRLLLADKTINVNARDLHFGQTPLCKAAENGHTAVAELLLMNKDVDPNLQDTLFGQTPLLWACSHNKPSIVKLLRNHSDTNINARCPSGRSALWWAAASGNEQIISLLLEDKNIDCNHKDFVHHQAPLFKAAENGHEKAVRLLLEKGDLDRNPKDSLGRTPLAQAARNGHAKVVQQLVLAGADVNSKDRDSLTPLSLAAAHGHEEVTRILIKSEKIELHPRDLFGRTPLSWAAENGYEGVIEIFFEEGACQNPKALGCSYRQLNWPLVNGQRLVVNLAAW